MKTFAQVMAEQADLPLEGHKTVWRRRYVLDRPLKCKGMWVAPWSTLYTNGYPIYCTGTLRLWGTIDYGVCP